MSFFRRAAIIAAPLTCATPALAHVTAGPRVFPVTLNFDDPGVGDELSLPALTYVRNPSGGGAGPGHEVDLGFEYDKRITEHTAIILNTGYDIGQRNGAKTEWGFENLVITGKWQVITNAPHEFVLSLGVQRELGGTGTTHVNGDRFGSTTPTLYVGKGLGDLPVSWLRPFAVTGELAYTVADKEFKQFQPVAPSPGVGGIAGQLANNLGNSNAWAGGMSLQYSIPYLQSQVRDVGLRGILADMIPVTELVWTSTASDPKTVPTTFTLAPGIITEKLWGELGIEAEIPLNRAAGSNVGVVALVHVYLDDLMPSSLGSPIF